MDNQRASREMEDGGGGQVAPDEAIERIESRAREIQNEQVKQALSTLDEAGQLTPEHRVVVAALANRLTERLIRPPKTRLQATDESDEEILAVALDLFGE